MTHSFVSKMAVVATSLITLLASASSSAAPPRLYFVPDTGFMARSEALTDGTRTQTANFLGRYQDLEAWVSSNPQAFAFAQEHMAASHRATVFAVVNFVASSGGLIAGIALNNATVLWSTLAVHLVLSVCTFTNVSQARKALLNSINTFNGVQVGFQEIPRPQGRSDAQAMLSYTFRI